MNEDIIKKLGLKENEAHLYMACLELGPSRAKDLSRYTNINRGTIYDTARSLFNKGLLSSIQKKNITYFVANDLHNYINNLENQLNSAKKILPKIEVLLRTVSHRPKLRFFEGKEGIKAVYEEILNCKSKNILCFSSPKDMLEAVGVEFMRDYVRRRARRHIRMRAINDPKGEVNDTKVGHSTHSDKILLRESKIGPSILRVPGMIEIYDDCVAMMSTRKENFGFIIESEEFATMMKNVFQLLWTQSTEDTEYLKNVNKLNWRKPLLK